MNSYNNTIVPRIVEFIEYVTKRLTNLDQQERKVTLLKYTLIESEIENIDNLRLNEQTHSFEVHFKFEIEDKEGNKIIQTAELRIPKMINNVFIIDGKTRIPTSTLDNSSTVRVYSDNIVINEDLKIRYSFPKNPGGKLLPGDPTFEFTVTNDVEEDLNFMGTDENFDTFKEYLKLSQEEKYKLQIKLDVAEVDDYLTKNLLIKLANLGQDQYMDSIIDKKINTTEENLVSTLYRKVTRKKILMNTHRKFRQYGIIYLTDVQNSITRYFKVADEKTIEIPSKVNPLVFDSLRYKITIPPNIAYNETFTDVIDAVNTPENTNVNRINELNICTSIEGGKIFIYCYRLDTGEKVKLSYLEYLNKPILSNTHYDYETNSIIESPEYKYKLRLKTHTSSDLNNLGIEYVEPKADEKLSITTRRIPLINKSDSVRVAMGGSMLKQAIEVANSEPRLISSGNDDSDYIDSSLSIKYNGRNPITIEAIKEGKVFYRDKVTGTIAFFTVENPIVGANDALITFSPVVKVGDELNPGELVITPSIMKSNSYDMGINALIFYMSYLGYTYEDGIVISESYAKKMTHYSSKEITVNLKSEDIVKYIRKIGDKVTSGDILVNSQTKLRGRSSTNEAYLDNKGIMKFLGLEHNQSNLIVPNNVDEGYVVDVLIQQNQKNPLKNEESLKVINEFLSDPKVKEDINLPDEYKKIKIIPVSMDSRYSCSITYRIIKINSVKLGDKLSNSWGSKGIVSLVLPDNEMPYRDSDKKRADILLNPAAVISRKNPSQLYETALSKIIETIYTDIDHGIKFDDFSFQSYKDHTLPKILYGDKFEKMTEEEFLENHKKGISGYAVKTGSFSKIRYEDILKLMETFDIQETEEVTSPILGQIESPVVTGNSYIIKLYHSADFSGKVTSSVVDSNSPYMGKGNYRNDGQKVGEMELWALLAYGTESFLQTQESNLVNSQYIFLNELLLAGYVMTDRQNIPYLSNYHKKLQSLKDKF